MSTKGELRKQRQAEHAAREAARLAEGDMRNAQERHNDVMMAAAKARRRKPRKPINKRAGWGSQEWAEQRGGLIGGYEED